ncbi:MAG: response regulator [Oligoflexia bacterium]|nr:response regulator [Oligoflexia bacterium]
MIDDDIYKNFSADCEDLLEEAEESLLGLIKDDGKPLDPTTKKNFFTQLMRVFHSIKGMSGMVGLPELNKHAHHLEDLLLVVSKSGINRIQCDYLIREIDIIRAFLKNNDLNFTAKYSVTDFLDLGIASSSNADGSGNINNLNDDKSTSSSTDQATNQATDQLAAEQTSNTNKSTIANNNLNKHKKDSVYNYFKRLPEAHIGTVKNILSEAIEGIEIKQNLNLSVDYYDTLTYVVPFQNNKKSVCGAFVLDFSDNTLPPIVANTIAKNIGLEHEFANAQELIKDVLSEFFYTIIGKTISEWSTLGLLTELNNLISNEDSPDLKLPFKSDNVKYLYEILFHLESGHIRFKILFSEKQKATATTLNKILIVDDSKTVRAALKSGLKKEHYITEEAADGLEAIEKYTSFAPNLVIIDLIMPRLGGMDAIKKIREIDNRANFIILSSVTNKEDAENAKELGVLCYITKPLHMSFILETINKTSLSKEVALSKEQIEQEEEAVPRIDFTEEGITAEDKILVVDDSKTIRLFVAKNLQKEGLVVIEATNGQEAIEKFVEFKPNIVIMDLVMPVMNGFDAMREIRRMDGNVKFIVLTSKNKDEGDISSLQAVDISSYILKPFDIGQIIEDVRNISSASKEQNKQSNKKILVVNKSKTLRHVMIQILNNEGFEIEEAGTGPEAVEKFKIFSPVLTIMDLNLPYLSGFEAMTQIRELNSEAKFVVLSSRSKNNDINKLLSVVKNALDH